jgi:serine/threonine protein kinase
LIFEIATGTLADLIKKMRNLKQFLPFDDFYRYTRTLIEGMAFLQSKGITHRDIKPDNILIKQEENKSYTIKIADFSESRLDIPNSTLQNMTIKGTPSYLSPELFYSWASRNELEHNPYRSDVYSLGLTLLELATLEKVLDGNLRKNKESDKNPKTEDHGPFDCQINQSLKNFVKIYENDKNVKNLEPIIKNMLSYQERHRFDFQTLEMLLAEDKKKNSFLSFHKSVVSSHSIIYEQVMIPSMAESEISSESKE